MQGGTTGYLNDTEGASSRSTIGFQVLMHLYQSPLHLTFYGSSRQLLFGSSDTDCFCFSSVPISGPPLMYVVYMFSSDPAILLQAGGPPS